MTQSPQPFRTTSPMTRIPEDLTTAQIGAAVRLVRIDTAFLLERNDERSADEFPYLSVSSFWILGVADVDLVCKLKQGLPNKQLPSYLASDTTPRVSFFVTES